MTFMSMLENVHTINNKEEKFNIKYISEEYPGYKLFGMHPDFKIKHV